MRGGGTPRQERADGAEWFAAGADSRAEFHHGLVVVTGMGGVEEGVGGRGEGFDGGGAIFVESVIAEEAGEDTDNVAVHDGGGGAEGDAGDGGGGVGADAGEREPGFRRARRSGERGEGAGEGVQETGAAVIAQAFPSAENSGFGGGGEGGEAGELLEPAGEVGQHGFDLRLLEHEFGDDGFVEGGGGAPGQRAVVDMIPGGEGGLKGGRLRAEAGQGDFGASGSGGGAAALGGCLSSGFRHKSVHGIYPKRGRRRRQNAEAHVLHD